MQRSLRILAVLWTFLAVMPGMTASVYPESSVKAAFLLRFADYVEWPAAPEQRFVIAVLGRDEMAVLLKRLAKKPVRGLSVEVRTVKSAEEARDAQILYVGNDRRRELRMLRETLPEHGVLVVTDDENGIAAGSAINFLMADGRVRFEASPAAARRAGLRVSSELLSVAARVVE